MFVCLLRLHAKTAECIVEVLSAGQSSAHIVKISAQSGITHLEGT